MFGEATAAATQSAADAKSAKEDAKSALDVADKFRFYNVLSMIGAAIGFFAVCVAATGFLFNLASRNEDLAGKLRSEAETAQKSINDHIVDVDRYGLQPAEVRASVPALQHRIDEQRLEISNLRQDLEQTRAQLKRVEQSPTVAPYVNRQH
jgi:phage shock protein A